MEYATPAILAAALSRGTWHDPGPDILRRLFRRVAELPDLKLYTDIATMLSLRDQLAQAGYVDDPEFCMVRDTTVVESSGDPRLIFDAALFVGGSIVPGDDVLVALDLRSDDPPVFVFDWTKTVPTRWVEVGRLSGLVSELGRVGDG